MSEECVKVLLLGEGEEDWSNLALHLEDQGCDCWLAKSTEDALTLLDRQKFHLVLTTKPLLLGNEIVERLEELNCNVFYRYPVGDGYWWLPAMDHGKECLGATALRPREFAGAIAQDTSSVKQVHNNLAVNPAIERNTDREHLGERVADLEIQTLVTDALSKNADLAEKHITTEVKNRTVALNGTVQTANQKYTAEQVAWQVPGVQGLKDNLSVADAQAMPESADDKLARRVEFELYSTKAIPLKTVQIHAENGVVTLTGTVLSRAEKLLAEKTAKSVEGVLRVVNSLAAPEET